MKDRISIFTFFPILLRRPSLEICNYQMAPMKVRISIFTYFPRFELSDRTDETQNIYLHLLPDILARLRFAICNYQRGLTKDNTQVQKIMSFGLIYSSHMEGKKVVSSTTAASDHAMRYSIFYGVGPALPYLKASASVVSSFRDRDCHRIKC